jgi:uncharacterized membrane protein
LLSLPLACQPAADERWRLPCSSQMAVFPRPFLLHNFSTTILLSSIHIHIFNSTLSGLFAGSHRTSRVCSPLIVVPACFSLTLLRKQSRSSLQLAAMQFKEGVTISNVHRPSCGSPVARSSTLAGRDEESFRTPAPVQPQRDAASSITACLRNVERQSIRKRL